MLIDSHCHIDFPEFNQDRDNILQEAKNSGIKYIINVGSTLESSRASVNLTKEYDFIYAAVGVHPHDADSFNEEVFSKIAGLALEHKVVAIGEIGLDYYRNLSSKENQLNLFKRLAELSKKIALPLVVHSREAQADTIDILKSLNIKQAVIHCFSGQEDFLKSCLDLGFFVSFTCNITYKKAQGLRDLIKIIPLERIFLETDAPYLSPEHLRGKRNTPLNVKFVAEEIAKIKQISLEEVSRITTQNAINFFSLK